MILFSTKKSRFYICSGPILYGPPPHRECVVPRWALVPIGLCCGDIEPSGASAYTHAVLPFGAAVHFVGHAELLSPQMGSALGYKGQLQAPARYNAGRLARV